MFSLWAHPSRASYGLKYSIFVILNVARTHKMRPRQIKSMFMHLFYFELSPSPFNSWTLTVGWIWNWAALLSYYQTDHCWAMEDVYCIVTLALLIISRFLAALSCSFLLLDALIFTAWFYLASTSCAHLVSWHFSAFLSYSLFFSWTSLSPSLLTVACLYMLYEITFCLLHPALSRNQKYCSASKI